MKKIILLVLLSAGCYTTEVWNRSSYECMKHCGMPKINHGTLFACNKQNKCECVCIQYEKQDKK